MVEIRPYTPEFKGQLLDLLTHLWTRSVAANEAHFRWKHETNPYLPSPLFYVALSGAKVVGARALFGGRWLIGGREVPVGSLGDSVVDPEYRNQGIMRSISAHMLEQEAQADRPFVFHMSSGPATRPLSMSLGGRSIGSLELLTRSFAAPGGHDLDLPEEWRAATRSVSLASEPQPAEMAGLVAKTARDGRIRHVRDRRYFAWRFGNPLARYSFFYWGDAQLEGYLITHTSAKFNHQRVSIVDWEATSKQVAAGLLAAAIAHVRGERMSIWSATLPRDFRSLLATAGFASPAPDDWLPAALIVPTQRAAARWSIAGASLDELSSWDLRMIYADSF